MDQDCKIAFTGSFPDAGARRENGLATQRPKRVRSACERCKVRRIKCDGQIPACGNCAKTGTPCIDVDSGDAERRVARGFTVTATARIAWLEEIIQTQLPHINLDDGPQVDANRYDAETASGRLSADTNQSLPPRDNSFQRSRNTTMANGSPFNYSATQQENNRGQKRPLSAVDETSSIETSVAQDTRSMALELGLVSLNLKSRQFHYLGSSSGSLFSSLLQVKSGHGQFSSSERMGSFQEVEEVNGNRLFDSSIHKYSHNKEIRAAVDHLYAQLRKDLPSRRDCDILLNRFFLHMHPNHPFIHRPSFDKMVDALYECAASPPHSQIQYNGWPSSVHSFGYNGEEHISRGIKFISISSHVAAFQLLMALSIGSILQIRTRQYQSNPDTFFRSAINLSNNVFGNVSLPVLQSVLFLILHSLLDPEDCNTWTLTHIAMAYAIDLGIHREVTELGKFSHDAIEMRKRIFFCVYALDRSVSTIQGRPLGLGDNTFDVCLPAVPEAAESSTKGETDANLYADGATLKYSIHVFKMYQLISRIKVLFYQFPCHNGLVRLNSLAEMQVELRNDLTKWLAEVPSIVGSRKIDQHTRLVNKLKIHYHAAICLLHQPSQAIPQPIDIALQICFNSAAERLRLYQTLYDSGNLLHSWRTVHDMFLAGTTIMYCIWISDGVRKSVTVSSLANDVRLCSSLLSVGGEWWPIVRKAKASFERLASRTLEMLAERVHSIADQPQTLPPFAADSGIGSLGTTTEDFSSESIETVLASVLNHDGTLTEIFDSASMTAFINGWPEYLPDGNSVEDKFWLNLDSNDEFTNST